MLSILAPPPSARVGTTTIPSHQPRSEAVPGGQAGLQSGRGCPGSSGMEVADRARVRAPDLRGRGRSLSVARLCRTSRRSQQEAGAQRVQQQEEAERRALGARNISGSMTCPSRRTRASSLTTLPIRRPGPRRSGQGRRASGARPVPRALVELALHRGVLLGGSPPAPGAGDGVTVEPARPWHTGTHLGAGAGQRRSGRCEGEEEKRAGVHRLDAAQTFEAATPGSRG